MENMSIEELQKLLKDHKQGWLKNTGVSPLKMEFEILKVLLMKLKESFEKDKEKQLQILSRIVSQQNSLNTIRVNKNV